ncbi:MAG: anti-sigma factor [bacterium]|nr:anti-sigma factor [bacterium]MDE0602008.1 anti-sigma factor [bacterium]
MNNKDFNARDHALEELLRGMEENDLELLDPPDEVWQGIESAVGADRDAPASVVPIDSRRRTLRRVFMGAAAAVVAALIGVVTFVSMSGDAEDVLATATLAYDPQSFDSLGAGAAAGANLVSEDGRLTVELVDATLPSPGDAADLEVWLIQPDDQGNVVDLISLGVVSPIDPDSLEVPGSHDPAVYFVVDISVEPRDGDAGHSGRSILRGALMDVN